MTQIAEKQRNSTLIEAAKAFRKEASAWNANVYKNQLWLHYQDGKIDTDTFSIGAREINSTPVQS